MTVDVPAALVVIPVVGITVYVFWVAIIVFMSKARRRS